MRDSSTMKDAENKVVTPFVAPAELKARQARALHSSEDIHVGPNTQLRGGFSTNGMMIIDGRVDGADITADRLVVSHIGGLEGKAVVQRAEISGVFSGELVAGDEVILRPTAKISGNVQCQRLVIHRGARIECSFSCAPDTVDGDAPASQPATERLLGQRKTAQQLQERKVFIAGAVSALAAIGVLGLLVSLKMLLS